MNEYSIPDNVRQDVVARIATLESQYDIHVLLAIESGSRAWGFASADSDFDVRMIYMHKPEWYWSVEDEHVDVESRGAINLPINDDLDIAGWDLKKTLGLLYKSNPPLLEWLRSPIVYKRDDKTADSLVALSEKFYSPKSSIYHYLHMAQGNLNEYLVNREEVKRKKYIYVIRAVLACRWIEQFGTFPPMEIDKTLVSIQGLPIKDAIDRLIAEKKSGTELGLGPADKVLETFLVDELKRIESSVGQFSSHGRDIAELNNFFRTTLKLRFSS